MDKCSAARVNGTCKKYLHFFMEYGIFTAHPHNKKRLMYSLFLR